MEINDPPAFNKAKSTVPFSGLSASAASAESADIEMIEDRTQVYQKRDRLF